MRPPIEPAESADLLSWLKRHGFAAWHLGREPAQLSVIVLFREHSAWVDVVHLRGANRVEAARLPRGESADIWRPDKVAWHYYGRVVAALTALRNLIEQGCDPSAELREPPREAQPLPLWITDDELRTKKAFSPPSGYPINKER